MEEIWKDIQGYNGIYQISNLGRVKSQRFWTGSRYVYKERLLSPGVSKAGYLRVTLSKDKKSKNKNIHRLVAEAFISNPRNLSCINHIDGNKLNNNINNLEWCTQKHNMQEAFKTGLVKIPRGKYNHRARKIIQKDLDGKVIKVWDYMTKITEELGFDYTNISKCCSGIYKKSYGYIWEYKED